MRHLKIAAVLSVLLLCTQSCFTDGYLQEKDFSYTLSVPAHTLLGNDLIATITLDADAPEWGYDYEFVIDDKTVTVPDLILKEDGTLDIGRSRTLKLNLTSLVTTMGRHTLVTKLHYNAWKTKTAEFQMDELITEIRGLYSDYSQSCDETVTIEPLYEPKDNTDTMKWRVDNLEGDNVLIHPHGDGKFDVKTEHGLPATCDVVFTTKNIEKKAAFDFFAIKIEEVTGVDAEYWARKDGQIIITPTIGPAKVMTRLDYTSGTVTGDRIECVTDYTDLTSPVFTFSTADGNRTEGEFTYSYEKPDGGTIRRTVQLHFYEPVTAFSNIEKSYRGERTDWVNITPVVSPVSANEPFECEVLSWEYDKPEVMPTSDGVYRFRSKNQKPSTCTVRFSTKGGVQATTKICFHHTVEMNVDVSVQQNFRITLWYNDVPGDWEQKPAFTVGMQTAKTFFKVMRYEPCTGVLPQTKNFDIAGYNDKAVTFASGDGVKTYTDNTITSAFFAALQESLYSYLASDITAALFVDETTDLYDVRLVPGTVRKVDIYYNRTSDCEPVVNTEMVNRLGCVAMSRSKALSEHTIEYWTGSEDWYQHIIRY